MPLGRTDLDQILCHQEARVVARDNTVAFNTLALQIDKQRGRRSCAGLRVLVRRHLNGQHSIWCGPRRFGLFDVHGRALPGAGRARTSVAKRTDHVSNRSAAAVAIR